MNDPTSTRPNSSPGSRNGSLPRLLALALALIACAGCSGGGGESAPASGAGQPSDDPKLAEIVGSGRSPREIRADVIEELKRRDGSLSKAKTPKKPKE